MLDSLTLDQLRTFVAVVDEGSFSAAARKLNRVQSAMSDLVSKLEATIGLSLFDRSHRQPILTKGGTALYADARAVLAGVDALRARAKEIASGVELELSVVVDVIFPMAALAEAARAFREVFPHTSLRIDIEALGGAFQPLLEHRTSLGIVGSSIKSPPELTTEGLVEIHVVPVASSNHPLVVHSGEVSRTDLAQHLQLILLDHSAPLDGRESNVLSPSTWSLADLLAKRAFLLEGLGWGWMPRHAVQADINEGRLVVLRVNDLPASVGVRPMVAAYPTASPPGPAGRWFINRLRSPKLDGASALQRLDSNISLHQTAAR